MRILERLFGRRGELPPLTEDNPAVPRLRKDIRGLESLASRVRDDLEVMPAEQATFVFMGRPPGRSGVALVEGGKVKDLRVLIAERGMDRRSLRPVMKKLRRVYRENRKTKRFFTKIARRTVVVAPAEDFAREVERIVREIPA